MNKTCKINPILSKSCLLGTKSCEVINHAEEVNEFLSYFMGEHYHSGFYECKCGTKNVNRIWPSNNNFFTPEGFFKLFNWAKEQDWWTIYLCFGTDGEYISGFDDKIDLKYISPDLFALTIYNFVRIKKNGRRF